MSIQTLFNTSLQGTNNIYGTIISNDDASFNNVNCNIINTSTQNISGNSTFNNLSVNGNTILNGQTNINNNIIANSQTITPLNLSSLDTNSSITNQLNSKQNTITSSSNISLNNLTSGGTISQTNTSVVNFLRGQLNIGSSNQTITDTLNVAGTTMLGYVLRMYQPLSVVLTTNPNDVISWVSGNVYYWANSVNTMIHSSTNIVMNLDTSIITGNLYVKNINIDGNNNRIYSNQSAIPLSFGGNNTTNQMTISSSGLSFGAPLYQGQYQRKCLLSSTGVLQQYPSWTTLSQTGITSGTINFDIGNNVDFPYFDNTNFRIHKIHFQGYFTTNLTNKGDLNLYPLNNGNITAYNCENSISNIQRTTPTVITSIDATNSTSSCKIMTSIENGSQFDFGGTITINVQYSIGQEFMVDGVYLKSSIGSTRIFGSFRVLNNTINPNINGLRFSFQNLGTSAQGVNFRYYVESI